MSGAIVPGTNANEAGSLTRAIYDGLVAEFGSPSADAAPIWRSVATSIAQGIIENIVTALSDTSFLRVVSGELVGDETGGGGGTAPVDATYLVRSAHADLTAERVVTDTSAIAWDWSVAGQAQAVFADQVALSVIGVANYPAAAAPAAIASAAIRGYVLHVEQIASEPDDFQIQWGLIDTTNVEDDSLLPGDMHASFGLSVLGRSANSFGAMGEIIASGNGQYLRTSGSVLGFGSFTEDVQDTIAATLTSSNGTITITYDDVGGLIDLIIGNDAIGNAQIRNSGACSVIGRAANSAGDPADISAAFDDRVLARAAGSLAFQLVSNAMQATMAANTIKANATAGVASPADLAVAADRFVGRLTGGNITGLTGTQATTLLDVFTNTLKGLVPLGGGNNVDQVLRGNQTWASLITRISGTTGNAGPDITLQRLTADVVRTSSVLAVVMNTQSLAVGLWKFKYTLVFQSSNVAAGVRFSVDFTGTTTRFTSMFWHVTTGTTDATGVTDQAAATNVGQLVEGKSERAVGTNSSATAGVDTIAADCQAILEGSIRVSTTGTLQLRCGGESATEITLMADTCLELTYMGA